MDTQTEKVVKLGEWLTQLRPLELAVFLKWVLRVQRRETEVQGIKLWVDPASNFGRRVLLENNYEADLTAVFSKLLAPGQSFVDVGANEGWFSMLAASLVGASGRVLACEPQERLWPAILKNVALNGFTNVALLPFAVGSEPGQSEINLYPSLNTGSSHIGGRLRRWEKVQRIEIMPLSAILDGWARGNVDLMKIDVEGFELQALQGAGKHLGSTIRRIVVEIHPGPLRALGSNEEEVIQLLESAGYAKRVIAGVDVWELR